MPICETCQQDTPLSQSPKPRRGGCGRRKPWNERGIYFEKEKYAARVRLGGKLHYLGRFDTQREAKKARNRFWAEKLGPNWQAIVEAGGHCGSGLRR
jgi:hypothetical protein